MGRSGKRPWTDEEDALIAQHYGTRSSTDIAKAIGRTRNMVIGRAGRLGLSKPRPIITSQERFAAALDARARRRKRMDTASQARRRAKVRERKMPECVEGKKEQAAWKATVPKAGPSQQGVGLLELEPHHCRSLLGYCTDGLPVYCGLPKGEGCGSYCHMHHSIYYLPTPRQRDMARATLRLRVVKSGSWA
jgi:hypothetical protein